MLGAVFLFGVMDATAKTIATRSDTYMALWSRYAGQTLVVAMIVLPKGRAVLRTSYPGLQLLRSIFLLAATSFFFFGIARIGLAEATAILDLNPVLITLGAAIFLGEKFGIRRAAAVAVSLVGALIIIRPGSSVFSPAALLPLGAAICYSGYALTTRFVGRDEDVWTSLLYTALLGAILLTVALPFNWTAPDGPTILMMALIGLPAAVGQLLMIRALQVAEASAIAPFGYAGLLFASLWGWILFAEIPDRWTILGMVVIAVAGLYVWWREMRSGHVAADEIKMEARERGGRP
ncbi:DMT family transporter [Palleronia sp. LCG004]|uniref:DMT family transporter n=1 Tax=Palleronia sp. LCG004 TaxID=3079304 RepID=UPI002942B86B|nr:DMT family transporter [Palleronia sp. LCG004]WOI54843.1 DMT family transporter [Palleronia sp. LCG004]